MSATGTAAAVVLEGYEGMTHNLGLPPMGPGPPPLLALGVCVACIRGDKGGGFGTLAGVLC